MLKHPILIAILLIALAASGCVAGQPVSPEQMAAVAPTVVDMVSQIAPQLAGTYSVAASDGAGNTRELSLKLTPDGNVELVTELADATQLMESGTWLLSGQGDVVVTLGTTEGQSIVEPRTIRLAVEGDGLVATDSVTGSTLRFSPGMLAAAPAAEPTPAAETDPLAEPSTEPSAEPPAAAMVEPSQQNEPILNRTFLSFDRAADGSSLLRALTFNDDGTVTLTSDYYNDEPVVIENGTWEITDDGMVKVTLTGQESGQLYLLPTVITFTVDGDALTAVDYDASIYGSDGLTMRLAANVVGDETAALITVDLQAGFPLDPTFVSVNGGGDLNAAAIDPECPGYVNQQPVVTVNWSGTADFVEAFFVSDDDPTLVVVGPDGNVYCNDDANDHLQDPVVSIDNPIEGQYRIWVGSYARNQLIPGVLVLTTNPDVNIGTFDLGSFIQRPAVPEVLEEPTPVVDMEAIQADIQAESGQAQLQKLGAPVGTVQITAEGMIPLFQLGLDNPTCNGLVNESPDHVFDWSGAKEALNVYFEGDSDATLLVLGPDESIACSDDSAETGNMNPQVIVNNAVAGTYAVWVGRVHPESPVTGTLYITDDASAVPAMLDAGQ